jgi:hypothetical protein
MDYGICVVKATAWFLQQQILQLMPRWKKCITVLEAGAKTQ